MPEGAHRVDEGRVGIKIALAAWEVPGVLSPWGVCSHRRAVMGGTGENQSLEMHLAGISKLKTFLCCGLWAPGFQVSSSSLLHPVLLLPSNFHQLCSIFSFISLSPVKRNSPGSINRNHSPNGVPFLQGVKIQCLSTFMASLGGEDRCRSLLGRSPDLQKTI